MGGYSNGQQSIIITNTYIIEFKQSCRIYKIYNCLMSAGFYLTSGILYLNMTPEILFVLLNRMKAQKIDLEKVGARIINDLVMTLYKTTFVSNITKPQTPIYIPTFYEIFFKTINSTALKLNQDSMQKLFNLIIMTIKKQFYYCSSCLQLYALTTTHFKDVGKILQSLSLNKQALQCLNESQQIFINYAKNLTYIQWSQIREEVLSMLESYHCRIVLFMELGIQHEKSGHLIYKYRNNHNRKSIGKGTNHPDIDIPAAKAFKGSNLDYLKYLEWPTNLGKDDYDDIRGSSSKNIGKTKITNDYEYSGEGIKEKTISQVLKLDSQNLSDFQVKLDLFGDKSEGTRTADTEQKLNQIIKNKNSHRNTFTVDVSSKIEKEFGDIDAGQGKEKEEEIDLLDMMDN